MDKTVLKAPFPYFGGKSRVASLVWERFGDVPNYVEPFFGSGAVLLGRPHPAGIETVNDLDCFLANFWRALQHAPDFVAACADWPVNECDLQARHQWLVNNTEFQERMKAEPDFYDVRIAGWWVWGISQWIGSGWCANANVSKQLPHLGSAGRGLHRKRPHMGNAGMGVHRKLPHLGDAGRGVHRKRPHMGNAGMGVHRKLPHLGDAGRGVHRKRPHLGDAGRGVHRKRPHLGDAGMGEEPIYQYMRQLADRLRNVRVCCGDWSRVLGPSPTFKLGITGVFLDPPYASERASVYAEESFTVAHEVREWAIANGDNRDLRIALCGYEGEHDMPESWDCLAWKAHGGYGRQSDVAGRENRHRERIWFSPHCISGKQGELWA